jgi:hypothetical protein
MTIIGFRIARPAQKIRSLVVYPLGNFNATAESPGLARRNVQTGLDARPKLATGFTPINYRSGFRDRE